MNYLKDRYSYITTIGPSPNPIPISNNVFSYRNSFDSVKRADSFVCHCGKSFRYYYEIRQHRCMSQHFEDRPINNINKE